MKTAVVFWLGLLSVGLASAAALVQTVSGDVRVERNGVMSGLQANQRVEAGSTVHASNGASAVLRFDDGQIAALSANTDFRIDGYRFDAAKPELDRIAMSLFRGSMRFITGLIGSRNRSAFALKTTTTTLGIRGTDFAVGVQGGDYLTVAQGGVSSTNLAGTANFTAGSSGFISSPSALAIAIPSSAIPPVISSAFAQLGALPMGGAPGSAGAAGSGGAAGAQAASSSAFGGLGVGTIAAGAAAVGVIAASGGSTGTTGTK
jgi:hypothetical protein